MKYFHLLFALLPLTALSQQTLEGSITHDGLERTYILFVPSTYEPGNPAPLVLNFHGYTSNNFEQMLYGDFRAIADTAGFLVVHPMGTIDLLGNPHWNVGWGSSTVDDVGFASALIDSLSAQYTIDQERIYSTGMSNGGFFSYKLACELSHRIAAIASVTGTMNVGQSATCNPSHPMPVMEIHGTADDVVAYEGNLFFASTPSVVDFWAQKNDCSTPPSFNAIPDTDQSDACTAEHYLYSDGNNGATVEHFKIIGGAHTWPGTAFGGAGTNQDINASAEIWRFFSQYDIHGLINTTTIEQLSSIRQVIAFPNPVDQVLTVDITAGIQLNYILSTSVGQTVREGRFNAGMNQLDLAWLIPGIYFLNIGQQTIKVVKSE
jgi:polyhydroxybutyrate depolymerase